MEATTEYGGVRDALTPLTFYTAMMTDWNPEDHRDAQTDYLRLSLSATAGLHGNRSTVQPKVPHSLFLRRVRRGQ